MSSKISMDQVAQILQSDLRQYIESGALKITDAVLTFSNKGSLKLKKFILDDGYEDLLIINFSFGLPIVSVDIDQFIDKNGNQATARKISDLIDSLLSNKYKLEEWSLGGVSTYRITTKSRRKFECFVHRRALSLPIFLVRRWGRYRVLTDSLDVHITVDDIHQVLDCDGMSAKEIEQEDRNLPNSKVSHLIVNKRHVTPDVADDFTRHYVDAENSHQPEGYFIAMFDDLISHVANDKRL